MEVYYKDLISEEATLDKLVDNLLQVVQGAEEFAEAAGAHIAEEDKLEITSRLHRLKEGCSKVREQAIVSAQATDKVLREYPYWLAAATFGLGVVAGALIFRGRSNTED